MGPPSYDVRVANMHLTFDDGLSAFLADIITNPYYIITTDEHFCSAMLHAACHKLQPFIVDFLAVLDLCQLWIDRFLFFFNDEHLSFRAKPFAASVRLYAQIVSAAAFWVKILYGNEWNFVRSGQRTVGLLWTEQFA